MSKLPKISAHNSDSFKTALGLIGNGNDLYKLNQNLYEDYSNGENTNTNLPIINTGNNTGTKFSNTISSLTTNNTATNQGNKNLMPLIAEARMNELETKLISLENTNSFINDKLKSYERSFEMQLKHMQQSMLDERDNREKVEKLLNMLTDQSSLSSNELKNKISLMQEVMEKEEKFKFQQRQYDIELYKNLINKLTDKVGETVRMEIDARFKADMDNKAMTQTMAQKIFAEMDLVRKEIDEVGITTKNDIKENSKECSERAHNLSKYIDQSISEAMISPNQGMEKLKNFVSKLTDQIKINMNSQNSQNKIFEERLLHVENFNTQIKEEIYKFVGAVEDRILRKFKELKNYTDVNVRKNFDNLNTRINELSKNTDRNISKVADQLIDTRNQINSTIKVMKKENKLQFTAVVEDIEGLATRVYSYEDLLTDYNRMNQAIKVKIENDLAAMQAKFEVNTVNERLLHKIEIDEVKAEIDKLKDDLMDFGQKVHNDMTDMMNNFEANYKNLFERSKLTFEQMNRMAESNIQMFEEFEQTVHKIHDETEKLELNNLMNSMLNRIEENNVYSEINKCKDVDSYLHQNVHRLEEELTRVNNDLKSTQAHLVQADVNDLMKDILMKIESAELKRKQNEMMDTFEQNEARLLESLRNIEGKLQNAQDQLVKQDSELEVKINNANQEIEKINIELETQKNNKKSKKDKKTDPDQKPDEKLSDVTKEELDKIREAIEMQNEENKRQFKEVDVKIAMEEMLNKVEFEAIYRLINKKFLLNDEKNNEVLEKLTEFNKQIYKIDKDFSDTNDTTRKVLKDYNEIIEAKINSALERIKKDNVDMWVNAVELTQKINEPEEIRKIIQQVPPVVIPKDESRLRIYELENDKNKQPKPELLKFKGKGGEAKDNKPDDKSGDKKDFDDVKNDNDKPDEKKDSNKALDDKSNSKPSSNNLNQPKKGNSKNPSGDKLDSSKNLPNPNSSSNNLNNKNKPDKDNNSGALKQDPNVSNKNTNNIK